MGRPTDFTPEIADAIIELMSQGYSVHEICSADTMPDETTFYRWLRVHEDFRQKYIVGRDVQTDALMDKVVMVANMCVRGEVDANCMRVAMHGYEVAAKRMAPRKYGDKIQQEVTGKEGGPLAIEHSLAELTIEELKRIAANGD